MGRNLCRIDNLVNDFFGQQEQARRNTTRLILLFMSAVTLIVLAVYVALTGGLFITQIFVSQGDWLVREFWDVERFVWVVGITLLIVTLGSLYRTYQLRQGGGAAVAEMLGAKRLPASSDDPLLRRLLNVVEEMAIASGVPVPPVYLMQQSGINAFAAGFGTSDAVIAVTNGAVELLSRDELQGVIAHEFSHILNGDTRLKMSLMGLLFGITLISDAGIMLMTARNSSHYSGRQRGTHPAVIVVGFLIFLVGTIGAVFADMIKRAVSRQREFLADAAAVQFTRNPDGIAGALKVIGGYKGGSRINHSATQQASHFFFGNAVKSWESRDWWATHPPLAERIRRLEPGFSGDFKPIDSTSRSTLVMHEAVSAFAGGEGAPAALKAGVDVVMASIGNPGGNDLQQARDLLTRMPNRLSGFAHDPFTARATMYALLLDSSAKIRMIQLEQLQQEADANVFREMLEIQPLVAKLEPELRLPLLEMLLPALKSLSVEQFNTFRSCIRTLIQADKKIGLFEYMMQRMLMRHLYPAFLKSKPIKVHFDAAGELADDVAEIITILIGNGGHAEPEKVFEAAMRTFIGEGRVPTMPKPGDDTLSMLDGALRKAERASPDIKRALLKACVFTVLADGKTAAPEIEMLRTIADALDAPMPQVRLVSSP